MTSRLRAGLSRLGRLARGVTPTGRIVLATALSATVGALRWGHPELGALAVLCGFCLVVGLVAVWVPQRVEARLELNPTATVAGRASRAFVHVTNHGRFVVRHPVVAVPMHRSGETTWAYDELPDARPDDVVHHALGLEPVERGVVDVGPAGARRTDPLGLFVRHVGWTGVCTLFVRPRMIEIEAITPGTVRDLDGAPTEEVTMNDLAFHALREYVPGDDLRHVHWRSSARTGTLHVRQYHDSRRSHVVVVVDDHADSYPRAMDFELALSIAASITVRLGTENQAVTYACGSQTVSGPVDAVLDATCRAELTKVDALDDVAARAARSATGASQLVLISGVRSDPARLQTAREAFSGETLFLGLWTGRPDSGDVSAHAGPPMLSVRRMVDLPSVLAAQGVGE